MKLNFFWSWDRNEGETVWYTATVESETQMSRQSDLFSSSLYRWIWGTKPVYPVPRNAKKLVKKLQEHFERHCKVLPVDALNSAKYHINLINSYLLSIPVKERDVELTVLKRLFNLFPSDPVIFSYLTICLHSAVSQVLTILSKHTRLTRRKSSFVNGPIVQRKWTPTKLLRMTPFLAFRGIVNPSKKVTTTLKTLL